MNSDQLKQTAHNRRNNVQKVQRPSLKIGEKVVRDSSGGALWPKPPTEMTVVKLSYINLS